MTESELHYKKMTETPVVKLVVRLGIPTTFSMLITSIYNMVDTYFVGNLGESPQGAIGILFTLQSIIQAVAFMLGHGSGTYVAKELANRDTDKASSYVSSAFFIGGIAGVIFTALGLIFLTPFMRLLGSTETILPYAKDYGFWVLVSCPFMICSLVMNNNLRYEGKATYAMIGLCSGGVLNMGLDYVFVRICDMGVFGAGMATAISQIISFVILLIMYARHAQSKIALRYVSRRFALYAAICRNGLPSLIRQCLNSVSGGALNHLAGKYGELASVGDAAITAMSVVNRISNFVMCVGMGISQGLQPVASFNYQAKTILPREKSAQSHAAAGACLRYRTGSARAYFPAADSSAVPKKRERCQNCRTCVTIRHGGNNVYAAVYTHQHDVPEHTQSRHGFLFGSAAVGADIHSRAVCSHRAVADNGTANCPTPFRRYNGTYKYSIFDTLFPHHSRYVRTKRR